MAIKILMLRLPQTLALVKLLLEELELTQDPQINAFFAAQESGSNKKLKFKTDHARYVCWLQSDWPRLPEFAMFRDLTTLFKYSLEDSPWRGNQTLTMEVLPRWKLGYNLRALIIFLTKTMSF